MQKINTVTSFSFLFFGITEAIVAVSTSAVKVSVQWSSDSDEVTMSSDEVTLAICQCEENMW